MHEICMHYETGLLCQLARGEGITCAITLRFQSVYFQSAVFLLLLLLLLLSYIILMKIIIITNGMIIIIVTVITMMTMI